MKPQKYEDSKLAPEIDRAMAAAAGHMAMDTQQDFANILPQIQQLAQMAQQFTQPKPMPMDGEAQAVLQASMAETQRRAARDQADVQIKKEQMALDVGEQRRKEQFEALMNTEDNLTEERMKTLDLTLEAAKLRKEQEQSVTDLQNVLQRGLNKGV
jgi:hypothetical protein